MSGARSAIDVMTAEDTALLDSMRNETDAPEVEIVDPPEPDLDDGDGGDVEEAPAAVVEPADPGAEPKQLSRTAKRIQELTVARDNARAEAAEAKQARAVSEGVVAERLRLLTEAASAAIQTQNNAPPPPPVEIPDINTDPVGHFKARLEQSERQAEERDAILRGFTQQQQQAQHVADLRAWGSAQEAEFATREPSYNEAMNFMLDQRRKQLTALKVPQEKQQAAIASDITSIAMQARATGENFAEQMYQVAQSFGYQKKAAEAAAPVIPPLSAGLPPTERAARAETARANSATIANVGASTPIGLTPDRIANMPEAEFQKYVEGVRAKGGTALRDLMGH